MAQPRPPCPWAREMTIFPYAINSLVCWSSVLAATNDMKHVAQDRGSRMSRRRAGLEDKGCPVAPTSFRRLRRATLSGRSSFISTKAPLLTFSTTLAGIGGKAGERSSGDCGCEMGVVSWEAASCEAIASSSDWEGMDALAPEVDCWENRGTAAIAWGGGMRDADSPCTVEDELRGSEPVACSCTAVPIGGVQTKLKWLR